MYKCTEKQICNSANEDSNFKVQNFILIRSVAPYGLFLLNKIRIYQICNTTNVWIKITQIKTLEFTFLTCAALDGFGCIILTGGGWTISSNWSGSEKTSEDGIHCDLL